MAQTLTADLLTNGINQAVRKAIDEEIEVQVTEAEKRMRARIPQIVAGVAVNLQRWMSIEHFGDGALHIKLDIRELGK